MIFENWGAAWLAQLQWCGFSINETESFPDLSCKKGCQEKSFSLA